MYKTGDKVIHQLEGACFIVDITKIKCDHEVKEYYILESILDKKTKIYVSLQRTDRIRAAITQNQLEEYKTHVTNEETVWIDDPIKRSKAYLKAIQEFDFLETLLMIKNLISRQTEKDLGANDKKLLVTAQKLVFSEISIVLDKEYDSVAETVNNLYLSEAACVDSTC